MQKQILVVSVLALAVAAALVACKSKTSESAVATVPAAASTVAVATSSPASARVNTAQGAAQAVEEVAVTGSRINRRGDQVQQMKEMARMAPLTQALAVPPGAGERYADLVDNTSKHTKDEPVSTFSIDVDTGSYSNVRRFLSKGQLPPTDAVRTEELINYFAYDYPNERSAEPFTVITEMAPSPFHANRQLVHIGIEAVEPSKAENLRSNLVFLLDVSGSMDSPDKLGLLKTSLKLLTRQLDKDDSIAIVVYAGASGVVLEPTKGDRTSAITSALDRLQAGGGTNGEAGIQLAYSLAQQHFIEGGINRVLLATDGDFNVGIADFDALKKLIEQKRKTGISLTTLGFGTGNYNDQLMEQLADAGNGNYAYIDNVNEARKVLVDEIASTLQTVAKDVKIQIEFNPAVVSEYRLIGYENRLLAREDFNNDKVDAGEIGAGAGVTALYEIALVGSAGQSVDPLRYGWDSQAVAGNANELAWLKLRYKAPDADTSKLLERPLLVGDIKDSVTGTSVNYRFAAAVAGFGQLLRSNQALGDFDYDDVLQLANAAKQDDDFGYKAEFIGLVKTAQALTVN